MLRVGLTGDLGSGKSTVARMLAERGAFVLSSDEMGRDLMQPGERVYDEVIAAFGSGIVAAEGTIDRRRLAAAAFDPARPRIEELNAIVHPAVIEAQSRQLVELAERSPHAIAVVESALIFSTTHLSGGGTWQSRFDRILVVEAPEGVKIARFVNRMTAGKPLDPTARAELESDARRRLAVQHAASMEQSAKIGAEVYSLLHNIEVHNDGSIEQLTARVGAAWAELQRMEAATIK